MNSDIENVLKKAIRNLRPGMSEEQTKQTIVVQILRALGWDDADPDEFVAEFRVKKDKKVDYALCDKNSKKKEPLIFIEAKRMGAMDIESIKHREQLFEYANNEGIPILILTDGNCWDFYLSMEKGSRQDRRFYRIQLQGAGKIKEHVEHLKKFLERDRVISGKAKKEAEGFLENKRRRDEAKETIPVAWRNLLKNPGSGSPNLELCELLAHRVEDESGFRPELDDIERFLCDQAQCSSTPVSPPIESSARGRSTIVGFRFNGKKYDVKSARAALTKILELFSEEKQDFMERFAKETTGRTRRLVARDSSDLYESEHLVEQYSLKLKNGWWLGTNLNTNSIRRYIEIACEVAGVKFDSDLILI